MRVEELFFNNANINYNFKVTDSSGTYNWKQIKSRILGLYYLIIENKRDENMNVAIICKRGVDYMVAVFAAFLADCSVLPININTPPDTLKYIYNKCHIPLVITDFEMEDKCDNTKVINERKNNIIDRTEDENIELRISMNKNDVAFLLMTSGTTGEPKYVQLSHEAIVFNIKAVQDYLKLSQNDKIFIMRAYQFVGTLVGEILLGLYVGCNIYMFNDVNIPNILLKKIEQYKITFIGLVPPLLRQFTMIHRNFDLSNLRIISTSGSVIDEELLETAEKVFSPARIINVYGMTEAGARIAARRPNSKRVSNSVGQPIINVSVEIRNQDGNNVKNGEVGEIWIRTPSMMDGYYENKIETNKKIVDGWLRSGDRGYLDENNNLFVLGRIDDVIVRNAQKVDPYRVENCIKKINGIEECVVFGMPDKMCGNKIICVVKISSDSNLSKQNIFAHCSKYLLPNESPMVIEFWDRIPVTNYGKISRKLIQKIYSERLGKD